jgi:hypothetical protein
MKDRNREVGGLLGTAAELSDRAGMMGPHSTVVEECGR